MPNRASIQEAASRQFTLHELRQAVGDELLRRNLALACPSMATVKAWSAAGQIDASAQLQDQVDRVIAQMLDRRHYYKSEGKSRGRPASAPAAASPPRQSDPAPVDQALLQLMPQLQAIAQTLQALQISAAARPVVGAATGTEDLTRAVAQLDAVRQHLMRRHDAELTLLRQGSGAGAHNGPGPSASDVVRLEGRLHRLEQSQGRIQSLLEQALAPSLRGG